MDFGGTARGAGRMTRRSIRRGTHLVGAAALAGGLAGCGQFGDPLEALGARIPQPDEFQVMQYEPPVIPASWSLPEPRPGAPSPRAPNPDRDAVAALLGPQAAARLAAAEPSEGEELLLNAADAASTSGDIRVQLEEDKRQAEASQPYQPPLLWDLLGLTSPESRERIDETQVIDPDVESERLLGEGVPSPVDPEAAARARAEAEREDRPPPPVVDRLPNNRITPPPEPAF